MSVRRRGSKAFSVGQPLCITILLFAVSAVNASPTISQQNVILAAVLPSVDAPATTSHNTDIAVAPTNIELATLGKELLQPSTNSTGSNNLQGNSVKSLPAVPAALLMVLTGFLCVSLVKDHRAWMAVLTGILWVGLTGIQSIPQLALRISHRNHAEQSFSTKLIYRYCIKGFPRLYEDTKIIQRTGLLLGGQYDLNPPLKRRAYHSRQYTRFSPAFTFENLSRGPPNRT